MLESVRIHTLKTLLKFVNRNGFVGKFRFYLLSTNVEILTDF